MYSECLSEKIALVIIGVFFFGGGAAYQRHGLAKKTKTNSLGVEVTVLIRDV